MIRIAICDDEKSMRDNVKRELYHIEEKCGEEFYIKEFDDGKKMTKDLENNIYDVILLDIIMNEQDGIETAQKIREMDLESYIIFISSYDKKWQQLFGVRTLGFLDKPVSLKKLEMTLREVSTLINREKEKNNVFAYTVNKVKKFEYYKNIICFESTNKRIEMVTTTETMVIYDTLKNVWNEVQENAEFVMLNRSFIINLKYSVMDKSNSFYIKRLGLNVSVGRAVKEEVKNKYMKFLRRTF